MSFEMVRQYFKEAGLEERVKELEHSSATVAEAALAIGCEEKKIAKTLSFLIDDKAVLIVAAGDAKVDNKKYKNHFGKKAKMIPYDRVAEFIGHQPGGVCPFMVSKKVDVYLDESLKRFEIVYPAAGSSNSVVELSLMELEQYSKAAGWIDVCAGWEDTEKIDVLERNRAV